MEKAKKEGKQKLSFRFVLTRSVIENSKKIGKIFKKLKNTIVASFKAKKGWKRPRKRENKNLSFCFVPTRRVIENTKKIAKKFRTFKNTVGASFQAIIGLNRPRNRENKYYHSVSFQPDA